MRRGMRSVEELHFTSEKLVSSAFVHALCIHRASGLEVVAATGLVPACMACHLLCILVLCQPAMQILECKRWRAPSYCDLARWSLAHGHFSMWREPVSFEGPSLAT